MECELCKKNAEEINIINLELTILDTKLNWIPNKNKINKHIVVCANCCVRLIKPFLETIEILRK